ncbi:hypothetical protein WJX74_000590 [Apatococcus lobatus]|uniref:Uncharacterized protein n=1 Tax=Apatococcus lobatus TaxID=904363 RepID=A0AAW1QW43_9CHLO
MAATVLRFRSRGIRTPYGCSQAISKEASRSFDQQAPPDHIFLAGRLIGAPGDLSIIWRSAYTHHTLSQVCLTNARGVEMFRWSFTRLDVVVPGTPGGQE